MAATPTLLTCDESSLVAASTSPWLLSSACALANSPLTTPDQGRELARRLALLLPERPQLQPVLLGLCRRFGLLQGLRLEQPDAQLLPYLRAAHPLLATGSEPLCAAVELGQLLPLLTHPSAAVRGQAAQLVCARLRTSDASRAAFLTGALVADPAAAAPLLLPRELTATQAARGAPALELAPSAAGGAPPEGLACVGSELVVAAGAAERERGEIVATAHAEAALRAMALSLGAAQPVLLSGPSGCGKTALLGELARRLGRGASMVKVHLDEQLDSKVLLGSYVCSEAAGEFQWQPNPNPNRNLNPNPNNDPNPNSIPNPIPYPNQASSSGSRAW